MKMSSIGNRNGNCYTKLRGNGN